MKIMDILNNPVPGFPRTTSESSNELPTMPRTSPSSNPSSPTGIQGGWNVNRDSLDASPSASTRTTNAGLSLPLSATAPLPRGSLFASQVPRGDSVLDSSTWVDNSTPSPSDMAKGLRYGVPRNSDPIANGKEEAPRFISQSSASLFAPTPFRPSQGTAIKKFIETYDLADEAQTAFPGPSQTREISTIASRNGPTTPEAYQSGPPTSSEAITTTAAPLQSTAPGFERDHRYHHHHHYHQQQLPATYSPQTRPQSQSRRPDLPPRDPASFGRLFPVSPGGGYRVMTAPDGLGVDGLMTLPANAPMKPGWLSYIGVQDVDGTADRIRQAGGHVDMEPADIPGIGSFAFVADPEGTPFLHSGL